MLTHDLWYRIGHGMLLGIVPTAIFFAVMLRSRRKPQRTKNDVNLEIANELRGLRGAGPEANDRRADLVIALMDFISNHEDDDMGVFAVRQLIMLIADESLSKHNDRGLLTAVPDSAVRSALDDGETLIFIFREFRRGQPGAAFVVKRLLHIGIRSPL